MSHKQPHMFHSSAQPWLLKRNPASSGRSRLCWFVWAPIPGLHLELYGLRALLFCPLWALDYPVPLPWALCICALPVGPLCFVPLPWALCFVPLLWALCFYMHCIHCFVTDDMLIPAIQWYHPFRIWDSIIWHPPAALLQNRRKFWPFLAIFWFLEGFTGLKMMEMQNWGRNKLNQHLLPSFYILIFYHSDLAQTIMPKHTFSTVS